MLDIKNTEIIVEMPISKRVYFGDTKNSFNSKNNDTKNHIFDRNLIVFMYSKSRLCES